MDTAIFFPTQPNNGLEQKRLEKRAKDVCARCEVRRECLDYALPRFDLDGVWGGKTPGERKRLRREMGVRSAKDRQYG